jgi:hypothetical protein
MCFDRQRCKVWNKAMRLCLGGNGWGLLRILRGLLNCTRQWGKSTVVALKAVHHAFRQANRLVAGK